MSTFLEEVKEFNKLNAKIREDKELTQKEQTRWLELKEKIKEKITQRSFPLKKDMRKSIRTPTDIAVKLHTGTGIYEGCIRSLSEGGAFIQTESTISLGEKLTVAIEEEDMVCKLEGKVLWINSKRTAKRFNLIPGIGLQFINITSKEYKFLSRLIDISLIKFADKIESSKN